MKGTLISADFITDENDDLRLLEINTDTGFISASFSSLDFTELFNVFTSESIDTVHVIYKDFHLEFVDYFSSSLNAALSSSVTTFERDLIEICTIYPEAVTDADNKFILRLAYDESAILDSEYAKDNINLYKLYADNSDSGSIVPFAYSSSAFEHDNLGVDTINSTTNLPDIAVRNSRIGPKAAMSFFKIGNSTSSSLDRLNHAKEVLQDDDTLIQKYYTGDVNANKVSSIRSYKVIYGSDLDIATIGEYEVEAILEKPTSIPVDDDLVVNWMPTHHYFEFTTNEIRVNSEGIIGEQEVVASDGTHVPISGSSIGDSLKSYYIHGAPDTDEQEIFREWSHAGSTLPSGSYATSSQVTFVYEEQSKYNAVANITLSSGSFRVSPFVYLLVYDSVNNQIVYRFPYEMNTSDFQLFDESGSLESISSINIEILSGSYTMYSLNLEEVDNFILADGGLSSNVVTHNCFVAGTEIILSNGDVKNIEDINVGEEVLTFNEETQNNENGVVGKLKQHEVNSVIRITLDNENVIITTSEHPFYVNGKGWVKASEIEVLDTCKKVNGEESLVSTVDVLDETHTVYNLLSVSKNHNFYANGILVHNK